MTDIDAAVELVLHVFRGYVDKTEPHLMLSAFLTAIFRPSLPFAPMLAIDGNAPGVGKGLLAKSLGVLNLDKVPHSFTEGSGREEMIKRLETAMQQGEPMIFIDNVTKKIEGSAFASLLTEPKTTIRTFNSNTISTTVTNRQLVVVNGNNLDFSLEMRRRTLPIRIVDTHGNHIGAGSSRI